MQIKNFFFDLETTGVNHWQHGIHQISGAIEIDGKLIESFNFRVQPNPAARIEEEALKVGNVTKEQVMAYERMQDVHTKILNMLAQYSDKFNKQDKFFLIGYNSASFDNNFLRAFFVQNRDNYFGSWFWSSTIDVMVLAAEYLKHKRHTMVDFKLKTVAAKLGIELDESKLHDAEYDIMLTMEIYKIVTNQKK